MYRYLGILLWCFSFGAAAVSSGWQAPNHLKAELVSEYQQVQPGQSWLLGLHMVHDEHWHTYWKNPGDSGLATTIRWSLPEGVTAGDIQWPVPQAISIPPLMNYGYEGTTVLLTEFSILADYSQSVISIRADVTGWCVKKFVSRLKPVLNLKFR